MKNKMKIINALILALAVISGLALAKGKFTNEGLKAEQRSKNLKHHRSDERKKWEASPDGVAYKNWTLSDAGISVRASHVEIADHIKNFTSMDAVVTAVNYQREHSKLKGPKWLVLKIGESQYMMQFSPSEFLQLNQLRINDKIKVKSRSVGYSPNHLYLILSSDYIEHNNNVIFKRDTSQNNGC
ncbi:MULTISPECIES: hypothetical protein [unclassified Pedobacter]|uniref:hypothetical protein n=1 Tax=unclassified Pedobacter TaxID=2628915 RepID=UPI001E5FFECC|nr:MULTISPECIES: hypothetical protein [unclassified Pedobacter]